MLVQPLLAHASMLQDMLLLTLLPCAAGEVNVFDTRYDVQWVVDGRLTGEPINLPRTELFRKKPAVTKPIIKAWVPEVATCEVVQVLLRHYTSLIFATAHPPAHSAKDPG